MSEEQILNAIAEACQDKQLRFQVIIQDTTLHIYINRPTQESLDYQQLKQRIYTAITGLYSAKFTQIWLYCRILGELEPDWQSVLELEISSSATEEMTSMVEAITNAVDTTNSIVARIEQELEIVEPLVADPQTDFDDLPTTGEDELFDLSEAELSELLSDSVQELEFDNYCFIRNRRLLYAVLDPPWLNIARLIETFDRFEISIRRSQLPILEAYLEHSINPDLDDSEPEVKRWWHKINELDSDNRHKLAIWLSRYCLNAEETISIIQKVIDDQINVVQKSSELPSESRKLSESINDSRNNSGWFKNLTVSIGNFFNIFKSTK